MEKEILYTIEISKRQAKNLIPKEINSQGFTEQEQVVHGYLMSSYTAFLNLDQEHFNELPEFVYSIHRLQDLLALRVLRRCYPDGWPTYQLDKKE